MPPLSFRQAVLSPAFEQLALNSVVTESAGVVQLPPEVARFWPFHPVEPPSDPVQDVAPVEDQLSVAVPPEETCVGDAFKLHESVAVALMV